MIVSLLVALLVSGIHAVRVSQSGNSEQTGKFIPTPTVVGDIET